MEQLRQQVQRLQARLDAQEGHQTLQAPENKSKVEAEDERPFHYLRDNDSNDSSSTEEVVLDNGIKGPFDNLLA